MVMEERVMDGRWELNTKEKVTVFTKGASSNTSARVCDAFSTALDNHKTVKKTSILNALNLPPED